MKQILIVGAGPTGLMAALTLAYRGIKPTIIDKKDAPISTSNALAVQPRTLEIWEEIGIADDALSQGHRLDGVTMSKGGQKLAELSLHDLPSSYPFILVLPQVKTERLLTDHLERHGVTVDRGVVLESVVDHGDYVETQCNGKTERYDYVLGCDGTMSTVRTSADIAFKGRDLPQHFIMADLHVEWEKSPSFGHVIFSENGPLVFFPFDHTNHGRLIADVTNDARLKQEHHPAFEDFAGLMKERNTHKASLDHMEWSSSFWVHSKIAETYQKGRLFLAGDAAHQHSPFGGQGMNTGIQDAYYLSNLLSDVIEGEKSVDHLNEYTMVRRPIGKAVVSRTDFMTRLVTSPSKFVQGLRNTLLPVVMSIPPIRKKAAMTLTQLIYR